MEYFRVNYVVVGSARDKLAVEKAILTSRVPCMGETVVFQTLHGNMECLVKLVISSDIQGWQDPRPMVPDMVMLLAVKRADDLIKLLVTNKKTRVECMDQDMTWTPCPKKWREFK